jgi:ankyrin repeat protein
MAQKQQPSGGPSYNDVVNFMYAACTDGMHGIVRFLDKYPASADIQDADEFTALHYAAQRGNVPMAELLLSRGATVHPKSSTGWTQLMDAARSGQKAMVRLLLSHGADINEGGRYGLTPLILAVKGGYKEIVEILLESGAIIDQKDCYGKDALMYADITGKRDIVAMLDEWPGVLRQRAAEKERQHAEAAAKFLKDTSFSGGIEKPMPAPRVLKIKRPGP